MSEWPFPPHIRTLAVLIPGAKPPVRFQAFAGIALASAMRALCGTSETGPVAHCQLSVAEI